MTAWWNEQPEGLYDSREQHNDLEQYEAPQHNDPTAGEEFDDRPLMDRIPDRTFSPTQGPGLPQTHPTDGVPMDPWAEPEQHSGGPGEPPF